MTVSTAGYYEWWRRNDALVAPFNSCSPNLMSLLRYLQKTFGATSLGCHNDRPVRGGTKASTHSWGAALDPSFPNRQITLAAMGWMVAYSAECGINAIHDYATSQIWYPSRGWHTASIQAGSWIHVETLPDRWGDASSIDSRLSLPFPPPGDAPMTPEDKAYIDAKFKEAIGAIQQVWAKEMHSQVDNAVYSAEVFLTSCHADAYYAHGAAGAVNGKVDAIEARLAAQEDVAAQILAAIQGASFPISGTAHIGTT